MSVLRDIELDVDAGMRVALEELARKEWLAEALRAQLEQEAFARHCRETNALDGLGAVSRQIDAFAYHDWAQKLDSYECWQDKGFNKYIDRIAPETKPVSRGTRPGNGMALMVGWTPPTKRYSKKFSNTDEHG